MAPVAGAVTDRHQHRHPQAQGPVRQQGQRPLPQPVRQRPPAGGHPSRCAADSFRGNPERRPGQLRLCGE